MSNTYYDHHERRHASKIKPLAFLLVELLVYIGIVWGAFVFIPLWGAAPIGVALLYFFMTSSLKRYHKVEDRQKYYEPEE
jgi:hypothetical protein